MPIGAASVRSRSWSADVCTSRACAASSSALMNRLAKTETLARSSSGGTGAKMKSTAPCGVAVGVRELVACVRGDEDDRGHLGLLALPDERGGLEPVHDRHPDVEQDDREVLGHDAAQRGEPGVGLDDRVAERRQHGSQRQPLRGVVVDDEDGDERPGRAVEHAVEGRRRGTGGRVHAVGGTVVGSQGFEGCEQLGGVDRLRDVVVGPGVDAALAFAGSRLAGDRDDREGLEPVDRPDGADGLVAVHDRHHDVHQHDVDVGYRAPARRGRRRRSRRR